MPERVCDWIAQFFVDRDVHNIYGLTGGGAAGLNDGFIANKNLRYICFHHEQAAAHAATAAAKLSGKAQVVNPTTGCGGTNTITGLLDAWQDSVPVFFVSGNVKRGDCSFVINDDFQWDMLRLRKYGIQEVDITEIVRPLTKVATFINDISEVADAFHYAYEVALHGRTGPVWIDVPADIQTAQMPTDIVLNDYNFDYRIEEWIYAHEVDTLIRTAERPLIIAGQGIRIAKQQYHFKQFIEDYNIPFVTTFGARDLHIVEHHLDIGAIGIKGSRAANMAMQNADLLLILGASMNNSHIGYSKELWAPKAKKIMIDIDFDELQKHKYLIEHRYDVDLQTFFEKMAGVP